MSSRSVHDATVVLQDTANAVDALWRIASTFSEILKSVTDLEVRVEVLERPIVLSEFARPRAAVEVWICNRQRGKTCAVTLTQARRRVYLVARLNLYGAS